MCVVEKARQADSASSTPGAPSAAATLRSTVAVSSRCQSMRRASCRSSGRARPRTPGASGAKPLRREGAVANRSIATSTARTAASVTSPRYRLDLVAARIGKVSAAHTGPASISASACSTVTPQSGSPSWIAQSSALGPRSPAMPG